MSHSQSGSSTLYPSPVSRPMTSAPRTPPHSSASDPLLRRLGICFVDCRWCEGPVDYGTIPPYVLLSHAPRSLPLIRRGSSAQVVPRSVTLSVASLLPSLWLARLLARFLHAALQYGEEDLPPRLRDHLVVAGIGVRSATHRPFDTDAVLWALSFSSTVSLFLYPIVNVFVLSPRLHTGRDYLYARCATFLSAFPSGVHGRPLQSSDTFAYSPILIHHDHTIPFHVVPTRHVLYPRTTLLRPQSLYHHHIR